MSARVRRWRDPEERAAVRPIVLGGVKARLRFSALTSPARDGLLEVSGHGVLARSAGDRLTLARQSSQASQERAP